MPRKCASVPETSRSNAMSQPNLATDPKDLLDRTQELHADPPLWPPRQSPSCRASGRLSGRPRCPYSGACRTRNRRGLPLSRARHRRKPLPALWPRTAAPGKPLASPSSGHRPSALPMGGLNRTGRSPAFMRYRMNPCASPLRATSTEAAAGRLASTPPIDPSAARDHTSRPAQQPDPQGETQP